MIELVDTTDYLLHADLSRLHIAFKGLDDERARHYRALISLTPAASGLGPSERASTFSITQALLQGVSRENNRFADLARNRGATFSASWGVGREPDTLVQIFAGHTSRVVTAVALSDGRVVSVDAGGSVQVLDPTTGDSRRLGKHDRAIRAAAVTPTGRIATGGDDGVRVWDPDTGASWAVGRRRKSVHSLVSLPNGQVVTGGRDGQLRVWDLDTGIDRLLGRHGKSAPSLTALANGRVVSEGAHRTVLVWHIHAGLERELARPDTHPSLRYDWLNKLYRDTGTPQAFDVISAVVTAVFPDGRLVTANHAGALTITTREPWSEQPLGTHWGGVTAIVPLPSGEIVTCGRDGTLRLWNPATGKGWGQDIGARRIKAMALLSNGHVVVDGEVWGPDSGTGKIVTNRWFGPTARTGYVGEFPDGQIITVWNPGYRTTEIIAWDTETSRSHPLGRFKLAIGDRVVAVVVLADDRVVAVHAFGTIRIRDPIKFNELANFRVVDPNVGAWRVLGRIFSPVDVATLPDGRFVIALSSGDIQIWEPINGQAMLLGRHGDHVIGLNTLPDGRVVSCGGTSVQIWDPNSDQVETLGVPALISRAAFNDNQIALALDNRLLVLEISR
jgi:WD40 repeat protein